MGREGPLLNGRVANLSNTSHLSTCEEQKQLDREQDGISRVLPLVADARSSHPRHLGDVEFTSYTQIRCDIAVQLRGHIRRK